MIPAPDTRIHGVLLAAGPANHALAELIASRFAQRLEVLATSASWVELEVALQESPEAEGLVLSTRLPGLAPLPDRFQTLQGTSLSTVVLVPPEDLDEVAALDKATVSRWCELIHRTIGGSGRVVFDPGFLDELVLRLNALKGAADDTLSDQGWVFEPTGSPPPTGTRHGRGDAELQALDAPPTPSPPSRHAPWTPPVVVEAPSIVPVRSMVVGVFSAATGVGKTATALALVILGARLGIPTLLADFSTTPPGNAALRLGFFNDELGLETRLHGAEFDPTTFERLIMPWPRLAALHVLRPIAESVPGTVRAEREGAYRDILTAARSRYDLVIVHTSPIPDEPSVTESLEVVDRAVMVLDTPDDPLQQSVVRLPGLVEAVTRGPQREADRTVLFVNKAGAKGGGWPLSEVEQALRRTKSDIPILSAPADPARHGRSARDHVPVGLAAGPHGPWSKLFLTVAGDLVPLPLRRHWPTAEEARISAPIADDTKVGGARIAPHAPGLSGWIQGLFGHGSGNRW